MKRAGDSCPRRCVFLCATVGSVALVTLTVLLWVQSVALSVTVWEELWERLDVPTLTRMSRDDLSLAGTRLVAYLRGEAHTPQVIVTIDGRLRSLYGERELAHLRDVKSLYRLGMGLRNAMLVLLAVSTLGLIYFVRTRDPASLKPLGCMLLTSGVLLSLLSAGMALPAAADFSDWWTNFHELSFSNDLWLLDPETEWLIKMFPLEFFFAAVLRIWLRVFSTAIAMTAAGYTLMRGGDREIRSLLRKLFRLPRRSSRPSDS